MKRRLLLMLVCAVLLLSGTLAILAAGEQAPAAVTLNSTSPACYQVNPERNLCAITWSSIYANSSPAYMTSVTITIDGRVRAVYSGFFQTNLQISSGMSPLGFQVACGGFGPGGTPGNSARHQYAIEARASDGLTAGNFGSVLCPAMHNMNLPAIQK